MEISHSTYAGSYDVAAKKEKQGAGNLGFDKRRPQKSAQGVKLIPTY